jgi:hypothetical protein
VVEAHPRLAGLRLIKLPRLTDSFARIVYEFADWAQHYQQLVVLLWSSAFPTGTYSVFAASGGTFASLSPSTPYSGKNCQLGLRNLNALNVAGLAGMAFNAAPVIAWGLFEQPLKV